MPRKATEKKAVYTAPKMTVDPSPFTGAIIAPVLAAITPAFTRTPPTVSGWYWHRRFAPNTYSPNLIDPCAVYVRVRILAEQRVIDILRDPVSMDWRRVQGDGWWAGPILAPEFKQ